MGQEVDLLIDYPKVKRDIHDRSARKTEADRAVARQFGREFFDGARNVGYGGHHYHPRFWQGVIPTFQKHFGLHAKSAVLDVGCAKGFMLYDLMQTIPGIAIRGIDISSYAIENAHEKVKPFVSVADARRLPFEKDSFDVVFAINTIHNFEGEELKQSLREIERVSRGKSFVVIDAYRTDEERALLHAWNLTAKSILHVEEWKALFNEVGYTGDYYWFVP